MYEGTLSFERFEYPSRLPGRAGDAAARSSRRRLPRAFGFDGGFFNAELLVPDSRARRG